MVKSLRIHCILLCLLTTAALLGIAPAQAQIYWGGENGITTAGFDGTGAEVLIPDESPNDLGVDAANGYIYWTSGRFGTGSIHRAALDGSGVETLTEDVESPRGLALDVDGGKIYWANVVNEGALMRANLDGTDIERVVSGEPDGITDGILDVAVDADDGKLYWVTFGELMRADLDGSNVEIVADFADYKQPQTLALDPAEDMAYWVDPSSDAIWRTPATEDNPERVVIGSARRDISLNLAAGTIYWITRDAFSGEGSIGRIGLDGNGYEPDLIELNNSSGAMVVVGGESTTAAEDELPPSSGLDVSGIYPNPFQSEAHVRIRLGRRRQVRVAVYDALGRRVSVLHDGPLSPDAHDFRFDAGDAPSGVYLLRIETPGEQTSRVMTRIR